MISLEPTQLRHSPTTRPRLSGQQRGQGSGSESEAVETLWGRRGRALPEVMATRSSPCRPETSPHTCPAPCSATPVPGHLPVPALLPPVTAASPVRGPLSRRDHCPGRPIYPSQCTALPASCGPRLTTALAGVQSGPPIAVRHPDLLQGVLGQFPWGRHPAARRSETA